MACNRLKRWLPPVGIHFIVLDGGGITPTSDKSEASVLPGKKKIKWNVLRWQSDFVQEWKPVLWESVIFSVTLHLLLPVFYFYCILFSLFDSCGFLVIFLMNCFCHPFPCAFITFSIKRLCMSLSVPLQGDYRHYWLCLSHMCVTNRQRWRWRPWMDFSYWSKYLRWCCAFLCGVQYDAQYVHLPQQSHARQQHVAKVNK